MTEIEKTTFEDTFRVLLYVAEVNPSRNILSFHVRLFQGGICTDEDIVRAPYGGTDDAPYRALQRYVARVAQAPHVMAACGHGWMDILSAFMTEPALEALRILDLRATAAALSPETKVSTFPEGFAAAFGLRWQATDDGLPVDAIEALTWHMLHQAGALGLDWPAFLKYATTSRHQAPFEQFNFDADALNDIPCQPGIYIMKTHSGEPLYVGKSGNLQARVAGYFSSQKTVPDKINAVWDQIADLDIQPAGSELEALLMEQQQIERLNPRVNTQRTVAEGSSRYGAPASPIVLILPSPQRARLELFWIGIAGATFQQRVNPARPPIAQLRQLLKAARSQRRPAKKSRNLIDWGPQGNEIATRVFGRHRSRLTWLETGATPEDTFITQLTDLMKTARSSPLEPAEIRMDDAR